MKCFTNIHKYSVHCSKHTHIFIWMRATIWRIDTSYLCNHTLRPYSLPLSLYTSLNAYRSKKNIPKCKLKFKLVWWLWVIFVLFCFLFKKTVSLTGMSKNSPVIRRRRRTASAGGISNIVTCYYNIKCRKPKLII